MSKNAQESEDAGEVAERQKLQETTMHVSRDCWSPRIASP